MFVPDLSQFCLASFFHFQFQTELAQAHSMRLRFEGDDDPFRHHVLFRIGLDLILIRRDAPQGDDRIRSFGRAACRTIISSVAG